MTTCEDEVARLHLELELVCIDRDDMVVRLAAAHCGNAMRSRKVGHCLYAEPCGHRLNEIPSVIHMPPEAVA